MIKQRTLLTSLIFSHLSLGEKNILLGTPIYKSLPSKLIIHVSYFLPLSANLHESCVKALVNALANYNIRSESAGSNDPINQLELRFIRLQYPYLDSSILSKYVALNAGKYNFNKIQKNLFKNVPVQGSKSLNGTDTVSEGLPFNTSGIKMVLAGRLTTQKSIPRKTVSNAYTGSFVVNKKLNSSINSDHYTSKNKLGSFTIKIDLTKG